MAGSQVFSFEVSSERRAKCFVGIGFKPAAAVNCNGKVLVFAHIFPKDTEDQLKHFVSLGLQDASRLVFVSVKNAKPRR